MQKSASSYPESHYFGKEKDEDRDQDFLPKDMLHIILWSWPSENLLLRRRRTMTMTKIPSRNA